MHCFGLFSTTLVASIVEEGIIHVASYRWTGSVLALVERMDRASGRSLLRHSLLRSGRSDWLPSSSSECEYV